jgi:DNA-directed RNA polymerase specialized sigma24 family protein
MEAVLSGTEMELAVLLVPGKEDEFEAYFGRTHNQVYRALLAVFRNAEVAEDALADAYAKAWERWDLVRVMENPSAWLARVAVNASISRWRRLRRFVPLESLSLGLYPSSDPSEHGDVFRAVASLPTRQRQVVALRIIAGFSTAETAEILGIAEGTVTAHMSQALCSLRLRLGDR